jgi:hypothetical protein
MPTKLRTYYTCSQRNSDRCVLLRLTVASKDVCRRVASAAAIFREEGAYSSAVQNCLYCVVLHSIADHHAHTAIQSPRCRFHLQTRVRERKPPYCSLSPIAVAERSKARTVFARSNTEIIGSNPTEAWMFVCVLCEFFLFLHSLKWDSQPT